jgi:anti-sigma factor RsiW
MSCHDTLRLIDAYVDDELSAEEAAAVGEHLTVCRHCLRQLWGREDLRVLVRALPYFSAPPRLRAAIIDRRQSLRRVAPLAAIAAAVVLAVGADGGIRLWSRLHNASVVAEQVMTRHVNALVTQHLVDVRSTDQHAVKPWFQGKLDFAPPVPNLADAGFPLLGGRVDALAGQPVAAVVYERRLHVITAFVSVGDDDVPTESTYNVRGFHEQHWAQRGLSVWIVSDLNAEELNEFAQLLRARGM